MAFLKLLKRLRIVLLQDAAILQRKFPQMAILAHRVFATPEWVDFSGAVCAAEDLLDEPQALLLERVIPEIAKEVSLSRDAVISTVQTGLGFIKHKLATIKAEIKVLGINQARQTFKVVSTIQSRFQVSPSFIYNIYANYCVYRLIRPLCSLSLGLKHPSTPSSTLPSQWEHGYHLLVP